MENVHEIVTQSLAVVSYVLPTVFILSVVSIADQLVIFFHKLLESKKVRF